MLAVTVRAGWCARSTQPWFSTERRLLEPVPVGSVVASSNAGSRRGVERRFAGDHEQRLHDGGIGALSGDQGLANPLKQMGAVAQHVACLGRASAAQIFEYHRQVVGQFLGRELKSGALV